MSKFIQNAALCCMIAISLSAAVFAFAAPANYHLFGDASIVTPGKNSPSAVELSSTGTSYSGVELTIPTGLTFADLNTLSADYMFTTGSCTNGSPRFQINVLDPNTNTTKNIFVYVGPYPNYTNCVANTWVNTGDLLETGTFVDTTQIGGAFYDTYANALTAFGSYQVTGVEVVADAGYVGTQIVKIDNVVINNTTYTFDNIDSCKQNGYQMFTTAPGPFSNQGQCVAYFARGGE